MAKMTEMIHFQPLFRQCQQHCENKDFKNKINTYDLINFMRDFRIVANGRGTYTNISRCQSINEKVKSLTGLSNIDALYLTEKEVDNLFNNCMLIDSEY